MAVIAFIAMLMLFRILNNNSKTVFIVIVKKNYFVDIIYIASEDEIKQTPTLIANTINKYIRTYHFFSLVLGMNNSNADSILKTITKMFKYNDKNNTIQNRFNYYTVEGNGLSQTEVAIKFPYLESIGIFISITGNLNSKVNWTSISNITNASIVYYVVNISEYNIFLDNDKSSNVILKNLKSWKHIINSTYFSHAHMVLVLNCVDIFREKIAHIDPANFGFSDYKGGLNFFQALKYFENRFARESTKNRKYYLFHTMAQNEKSCTWFIKNTETLMFQHLCT